MATNNKLKYEKPKNKHAKRKHQSFTQKKTSEKCPKSNKNGENVDNNKGK